jgi:hypothetical protein
MPCRYGTNPEHRVRIELVEADLEIGFNLVDLSASNPDDCRRVLAEAERVYGEILTRIQRLEREEAGKFEPLVTELRRAIDLALPQAPPPC